MCINILHAYRKYCATGSSSGQLILPEALKFLTLYTLLLAKSIRLRNDGRLDDQSYWASRAASLSVSLAIPCVYPRMISIHDLASKVDGISEIIPLSSEHMSEEGIYLLENGEDCLIYIGSSVIPDILKQLFGFSVTDGIPTQAAPTKCLIIKFDKQWKDKGAHKETLMTLDGLFKNNFEVFAIISSS